jgi:predicted nicotinamide N-methyase
MGDISDIFWQLESNESMFYSSHDGEEERCISFSSRSFRIVNTYHSTSTHYEKYDGEIKLLLRESRDDGVGCAIGGELWEASALLSCFMLFHFEKWHTKRILELGSGVGIPGLFISSLQMLHCDLSHQKTNYDGFHLHLTDYDADVLDSLCTTVESHFRKEHLVMENAPGSQPVAENGATDSSDSGIDVHITQLDWRKYDCESESDRVSPTLACDIIIGSELVYTPELACVADVIM